MSTFMTYNNKLLNVKKYMFLKLFSSKSPPPKKMASVNEYIFLKSHLFAIQFL